MGRLNIIHVLEEDANDIDLFTGRVDAEKCAGLFRNWIDIPSVDEAYICGPEPMMLAISEALKAHGLKKEQIRFELFASGQPGRARSKAAVAGLDAIAEIEGRVTIDGETRNVKLSRDQSLLQAARANNIDAPFACTAGVCSTCKAKLIEGEVEMVANHSLEDYEVEQGYILTCQSHAITEKVAWDYDQA